MKTMKMNTHTLLMALAMLATTGFAHAQQPATRSKVASTANSASVSVAGQGYSYRSDELYFSDKTIRDEDLKSKEVSKEVSMPKGGEIYIENSYRGIVVKTWDQPKVKVTTTIFYDGEAKLTDDEWLEKVNLSLKTLGSSVKIKSGSVNTNGAFINYGNGTTVSSYGTGNVAVFNGVGQNVGTKSNLRRLVTITVPAGSKLDIESKYADVTLPAGIGDANVDITNGNLEGDNFDRLVLRSKYSNVNIGDVKSAEVEFNNGRFSARNIDDLDIESKYSTIEMASAKKVLLRSTNDEYELEEAGEVRARKSYGNLRITKLNTSLEVDGQNADVKVRKVGTGLSLIKMDNKYADVRIPLRDTKNYSVDFNGNYSSVYGNFEKVPYTAKENKDKEQLEGVTVVSGNSINVSRLATASRSGSWDTSNPSKFTATVGDGKGLKVDIKCQNCTVDFK